MLRSPGLLYDVLDETPAPNVMRLLRKIRKIDRLFDSRPDARRITNPTEDVETFLKLFYKGLVRLSLCRIPTWVMAKVEKTCRFEPTQTESLSHLFLKACAVEGMREAGAEDAFPEVRRQGTRPDALSKASNWIVECGNTPIWKLLDAMQDETHPRFTLLPFQPADDPRRRPRRSLIAIDFLWGDELPLPSSISGSSA